MCSAQVFSEKVGVQSSFDGTCDSDVQKTMRCSCHHLGASTKKSLDACISCVLRDGGSTQPVLVYS